MNTHCANCNKKIEKWPYQMLRSPRHFCNNVCKGVWMSENCAGDNGYNWRGGTWNNRVQVLAHTSYRTWRSKVIGVKCVLCLSSFKLELHHIIERKDGGAIKEESNVITICSKCHDIFHSKRSKGSELRENLKAILAQDNPQPSPVNGEELTGKVQRLTGEEPTNKPDTSAAPERDEIVRAYRKL